MSLSKRLLACAQYTDGFLKLADIGTDHAQLPIYAVEHGYVYKALAIDNKEGPFVIAYSNVKKANLSHKIEVLKGDGINKIDDEVDVLVISGMGGKLIASILRKDSLRNVKRVILQANIDSSIVRSTMNEIGFKIVDELVLKEAKKYYDIIVFERGKQTLSAFECDFGPINLELKPFYFVEKVEKEKRNLTNILNKMEDPSHKVAVNARLMLLEEALK
jgi:tRNA (adenine22-N1)-methyltransferase